MVFWLLDPAVTHLNHGSFGACPRPVLDDQQRWRDEIERNPVLFFMKSLQPALNRSRETMAEFVGADPGGLVFVPNATSGINSVLRSLEHRLGPGDEILVSDHTYNACRNVVEVVAVRSGATLVEVPVPFPLSSGLAYASALLERVTPATRLVMVDAVTSPTGIIVPVDHLLNQLEPEVPVLVDAAHAPGMIPLHLESLGASFVVGNCHKWMCAPKGAGFLYVREDQRDSVIPAMVSHGWNTAPQHGGSRFHNLFDWTGTDDPSAQLSVPAAIETIGSRHGDGWSGVMAANHELAITGRHIVCSALGIDEPIPPSAVGSMATIPLPGGRSRVSNGDLDPLTERLRSQWAIEVPVFSWRNWPQRLLRISAQLYNTEEDYQRLVEALHSEL